MEKGKRLLWMDVIKVFSTFLIVMQHSISSSFTTLPVDGTEWKVLNFLFMISRLGVPVFFMCSGAGILASKRTIREVWRKNILGLLKVYMGWMVVFGIKDVVQIWINGENASLRVMVNAFLKCILFGKYHTWFILTLLGLYAIAPLLYDIVSKKEQIIYFILLSFGFTVFLPVFSGIEQLGRIMAVADSINMQFVVGYSLYFVTGYFICWHMDRKWEKYAGILLVLSAAAAYVLSIFASLRSGAADHEAYGTFSVCGFIMSVSVMILFKKYVGEERRSKAVNAVAALQKYGIAIYLMHVIFVEIWAKGSKMSCVLTGTLIWALSLGISVVVYRVPGIQRVLFIRRTGV